MLPWPAPHVPEIPGRGAGLRLFDPAFGHAEPIRGPQTASLAVCVATPRGGTHLGHVATAVAFDLVVRAWLDAGCIVKTLHHVMTPLQHLVTLPQHLVTPLQHRADADIVAEPGDLVRDELAGDAQHMTALGVIPPHHLLGPMDPVEDVVVAIERMLASGRAYRVPPLTGHGVHPGRGGDASPVGEEAPQADRADVAGGTRIGRADDQGARDRIYAGAGDDPLVGTLSGLTRDRLLALASEDDAEAVVAGRHHQLDALLWRGISAGASSGAGGSVGTGRPGRQGRPGRPGSDIVCATAVLTHLGGSCDVLGGGVDALVHHERTASHLRALTGAVNPVRRRVQTGSVTVDGVPMGRPGGCPVTVSDLLENGVPPMALRLAVLARHYRADWEFAPADLDEAWERLRRWTAAVSGNGAPPVEKLVTEVRTALSEDLDAPRALRAVDAWADLALSYGQPGGLVDADVIEGAPGVAARAIDALLGVRL